MTLSENQLKKAIREAVLSELDWKTYQNAAGKLYKKAREGYGKYNNPNEIPWNSEHGKLFQRAEKFQGMANDRFKQDYGEANYKTNPKGSEEFMHFYNGDYEYQKGKGWQLKENRMNRIVKESIKKVLKEDWYDEDEDEKDKYYVAADVYSDYFDDFISAYNYALRTAEESMKRDPENWEEIHLMDNNNWESLVIFNENGIHDLVDGTFTPWK